MESVYDQRALRAEPMANTLDLVLQPEFVELDLVQREPAWPALDLARTVQLLPHEVNRLRDRTDRYDDHVLDDEALNIVDAGLLRFEACDLTLLVDHLFELRPRFRCRRAHAPR